ncbi:unnamed protein product [Moneuplotes crassus]|uniref:Uncharacterized protein n=1 Tax=Euplotes crassus TaxID=5936 RepID=A0AAD1TZW0_EUPCR|nr:unnamed protein product [Moneuplotes crassus]
MSKSSSREESAGRRILLDSNFVKSKASGQRLDTEESNHSNFSRQSLKNRDFAPMFDTFNEGETSMKLREISNEGSLDLEAQIMNHIDNLSQGFKSLILHLDMRSMSKSLEEVPEETLKVRIKSLIYEYEQKIQEIDKYRTANREFCKDFSSTNLFSDFAKTTQSIIRYNESADDSKMTSNFGIEDSQNESQNPEDHHNQVVETITSEMNSSLFRKIYLPGQRDESSEESKRVTKPQSYSIIKGGPKDKKIITSTGGPTEEDSPQSLSQLKIKMLRLENELQLRNKQMKSLSSENNACVNKLMDASKLIDDLSSKYHDVNLENNRLTQQLTDLESCKKEDRGIQTSTSRYGYEDLHEEKQKLSLNYSSTQKDLGFFLTPNNSDNDEVLIGPDSPANQARCVLNQENPHKASQDSYEESKEYQENRCKSYESSKTNIFKTDLSVSKTYLGSSSCKSFEEIIKSQKDDIEYLKNLARTLLYKNIGRIKDAREAIGVIIDFLQNMDTMNLKDLSEYIARFYDVAFGDKYQYFITKLDYLKSEIEEIKSLNNKKIL